jgi:hypothetical protein
MDMKTFSEYLSTRYNKELKWYDDKSIRNKFWYYTFQISLIILSAITPLLALSGLKWPTTITASVVAILASLTKFLNLQENWFNYRSVCETLRKERRLYDAALGDYANAADKQQLFVDRVENLISREHTLWQATASPKEKKQN